MSCFYLWGWSSVKVFKHKMNSFSYKIWNHKILHLRDRDKVSKFLLVMCLWFCISPIGILCTIYQAIGCKLIDVCESYACCMELHIVQKDPFKCWRQFLQFFSSFPMKIIVLVWRIHLHHPKCSKIHTDLWRLVIRAMIQMIIEDLLINCCLLGHSNLVGTHQVLAIFEELCFHSASRLLAIQLLGLEYLGSSSLRSLSS